MRMRGYEEAPEWRNKIAGVRSLENMFINQPEAMEATAAAAS